jgi:predicted enzyme related to lactoylglutathione lyase
MPEVTNYASGCPSWADLLSHDGEASKNFYTNLFGWTFDDHPIDENAVYTMYSHRGKAVCAAAVANPGSEQENLPAHWSVYVTVDDLEAATERARAAGGAVIAEPFDVMDVGRMSIIQDRQGAFLRLWFPKLHAGAEIIGEPNALSWFELATTDTESASDFYRQVLQAEVAPDPDTPFPYTLVTVAGEPAAGIIEIGEDWGPVPPNWGVYFGVDDVNATVARAQELGGGVIVEATDLPDFARFAVLRDSEGAVFAIIRLNAW